MVRVKPAVPSFLIYKGGLEPGLHHQGAAAHAPARERSVPNCCPPHPFPVVDSYLFLGPVCLFRMTVNLFDQSYL